MPATCNENEFKWKFQNVHSFQNVKLIRNQFQKVAFELFTQTDFSIKDEITGSPKFPTFPLVLVWILAPIFAMINLF